jgi:hypothetical protein
MTHRDLIGLRPCRPCPRVRSLLPRRLRLNRLAGGKRSRSLALWCLACFGSLAFALACVTDSTPESSASAHSAPAQEPPFELTSDAPWPPEYSSDPLWARAATGDDFDQARLARREGAEGLLRAVERGGRLGRVGLASLEHASDRRQAGSALCALIARADAQSLGPLLAALLDVIVNGPHADESLDLVADARCPAILEGLAQRDSLTPSEQDQAAAVLARLRAPR